MFPLFETICIKNGQLQNQEWHQWRYKNSYLALYGKNPTDNITGNIVIPDEFHKGIYKLRIWYNKISKVIDYEKYNIKKISAVKLIEDNEINYALKFSNRDQLDDLYKKRKDCDDILIVKNGIITDSSYCNIIFFDGNDWVTPSSPLLNGTARERLLRQKIIKKQEIRINDLEKYTCFKLINAMRDFDIVEESNIKNIKE